MKHWPLFDTHAHLCSSSFDTDREDIIAAANIAGVQFIVGVAENLADAEKNRQLHKRYPAMLAAAGCFPGASIAQAQVMIDFINTHRQDFCAIGEIGLDYWLAKEEKERDEQRQVFAAFVDLALHLGLPVNVHSRSAGRQTIKLLLDMGATRVQMHAFDGKYGSALPGIEAGYFFSIPPSLVRSPQKQKLVKNLPLECLLCESDSPVLGPDPQKRNEPKNCRLVVEAIAEIKRCPVDEVAEILFENACRVYDIDPKKTVNHHD